MNTKLTYLIKNNSESYQHVLSVLEEYGDKATFRVNGVRYLIKDAKPQGKKLNVTIFGVVNMITITMLICVTFLMVKNKVSEFPVGALVFGCGLFDLALTAIVMVNL